MGYWGYLVATKSDVPLDQLAELATFGEDYVRVEPLHDGWQLAWVAGANVDPLVGAELLAKATGHPVLAAFILDSDCGPVAAATPDGLTWSGTLAKSMAINSYEMPDDGITQTAAVDSFLTWTTTAGLPTNQPLVTQALSPDATAPEHLLTLLLQSTGIAPLPHDGQS
ncbi:MULTISPECIES: hypothetical protein [unclassified Kribbella]|uniref:hypothetical protein n=1 Tax=unclassified Kribbella TaxID=2644121 RepID=UPI0033DCEA7F